MDQAGLWELAEGRRGIFTRAEARKFGASDHRLEHWAAIGIVQEVLDDVFRLIGPPFDLPARLLAATSWASPAAASHRAAAFLWGLDGFREPPVEIITERQVHQPDLDMVIHYSPRFYGPPLRTRLGIPVTSIEQTIAQLGAVCPPWKVAQGMDDALRQGLTSLDRLVEHLARYSRKGRRGMGVMRHLLKERVDEGYMQSLFEKALFRTINQANLPAPNKQHPVPINGRTFRLDFAYVHQKIAIEALGYSFHSARDRWESDQDRHTLLGLAGWTLLFITYRQLMSDPAEVAARIRAALANSSAA